MTELIGMDHFSRMFRKLDIPQRISDELLRECSKMPILVDCLSIISELSEDFLEDDDPTWTALWKDEILKIWIEFFGSPRYQQRKSSPESSIIDSAVFSDTSKRENIETGIAHNSAFVQILANICPIGTITDANSIISGIDKAIELFNNSGNYSEDMEESGFKCFIDKLPTNICMEFDDRCERGIYERKFRDLKIFLFDQMEDFIPEESNPSNLKMATSPTFVSNETTTLVEPLSNSTLFCTYCRKAQGHLNRDCPILKSTVCSKCSQVGHSARYCPTRKPEILAKIFNLLDNIQVERVNLTYLLQVTIKMDNIISPLWRDEALQLEVLEQLYSKLPQEMLDDLCMRGRRFYTIRSLKIFLDSEIQIKNRYADFNPRFHQQGLNCREVISQVIPGQQEFDEKFCAKCNAHGHLTEDCVDVMVLLGLAPNDSGEEEDDNDELSVTSSNGTSSALNGQPLIQF